jgi:hypothetical protein
LTPVSKAWVLEEIGAEHLKIEEDARKRSLEHAAVEATTQLCELTRLRLQNLLTDTEFVGLRQPHETLVMDHQHDPRAEELNGSGQFGPVVSFRVSDLLLFWIFRFIIADALKTNTRRGKIGTSTPVFGFRPMRWRLLRTVNVPNDDNFTVSPRAMVFVISFNTRSTRADDSVRVNPTFVR